MGKRRINAREALQDIRTGMTDAGLMEKYELTSQGVQSLYTKLVDHGLLTQEELDARTPLTMRTVALDIFRCPSCGYPQFSKFDVCPQCGVIVSKYSQQKTKSTAPIRTVPATQTVLRVTKVPVSIPADLHELLLSLGGPVATHVERAIRQYLQQRRR
jgi:hypothetical protein